MSNINRPTGVSFNAGSAKANQSSGTDPMIVESVIDFDEKISGIQITNNGELVMGVYSGAMSVQNGVLRTIAAIVSDSETKSGKIIGGVEATAGVSQVISGVDKLAGNVISGVAASTVDTAAKASLVASAGIFSKIGSAFGTFYSALTLVQPIMKIHAARMLIKDLIDDDGSAKFDTKRLKKLAPKSFASIQGDAQSEVDEVSLSLEMRKAIIKDLESTIRSSSISIGVGLFTITSSVLGFIFTGGIGAIVAVIIGLVANSVSTVTDGKSMIEALKSAKGMSDIELALKVLTAVLAGLTLALSVAFAPHIALAVASGLIGTLMMSIPVASIFHLKTKEEVLCQEAAEQKRLKEEIRANKTAEEKLKAKHILELEALANPKAEKYLADYFYEFNENSKVNLKVMKAVNSALKSSVFGEDEMYRLNSSRALVKYRSTEEEKGTAELFFSRIKGQKAKVAFLYLEEGEKIDIEVLKAVSEVCDLDINETLYTKEEIKLANPKSKVDKEVIFNEALLSGERILGKGTAEAEAFKLIMNGKVPIVDEKIVKIQDRQVLYLILKHSKALKSL